MKTYVNIDNSIQPGIPHQVPFNDKKRKCPECGYPLSRFNLGDRCHSHDVTEEEVYHKHRQVIKKQRMDDEVKKVQLWMQNY